MKTKLLCLTLTTFFIVYSNNIIADDLLKSASNGEISTYITSESFSNILPIKQLIEDDWKQSPANNASKGFTQNEIGLKVYWHNISFNMAHRVDYFVFTNNDTAQAFYLERTDQPLTTQDSYQLSLQLHHQESNGFRLGYQWQFDNFTTEINLGYWDVSATRESEITGEIFGDNQNNITGTAQLNEFYSDKNFLKRDNYDRWDIDGYGITLDLSANWQVNNKLNLRMEIRDLYTFFKMKNLGYSQGKVETNGTFINSLGGKSYLPLYRGIETSDDYQFNLPENINVLASYQGNSVSNSTIDLNYLARYKRQGEVNFYYLGTELKFSESSVILLLDIEHLSPEVQYSNKWFNMTFAIDDIDIEKAMQFSLGVSVNYAF